MKQFKIFLTLLVIGRAATVNAQQVIAKFRSLTYVTYEIAGKKAVIKDIVEISEDGKARCRSVWYNGIADTTYQLTESKLKQLNRVFNGAKPLKSFMESTKLPENEHFAGPLEYVVYTNNLGGEDHLTIVSPFMNNEFNEALEYLGINPSKIKYKGKTIINPGLARQILSSEKQATYIPKIEEQPTVLELH
ncbi:hypothetical protein FFF34_013095 [Inquilinus sp. KBS0705]|nr:hypothetical protein FFF34_013095 [Inquilinus sp. KBS0705]